MHRSWESSDKWWSQVDRLTCRGYIQNQEYSSKASLAASGLKPLLSAEDLARQRYPWWWVLPLQPGPIRKTLREELVPDTMWSFEQPHGAINIVVNIRMTAVRLQRGGLWLHAPVAPTQECIELVNELESRFVHWFALPVRLYAHSLLIWHAFRRSRSDILTMNCKRVLVTPVSPDVVTAATVPSSILCTPPTQWSTRCLWAASLRRSRRRRCGWRPASGATPSRSQ
jgi:hypothetical protein